VKTVKIIGVVLLFGGLGFLGSFIKSSETILSAQPIKSEANTKEPLERLIFLGMTKNQVKEVLGTPYYDGGTYFKYSDSTTVRFNSEERVSSIDGSAYEMFASSPKTLDSKYEFYLHKDCGKGITKDFENAFSFFEKLGNEGNHNAQFMLAECYFHGEGVRKNPEEAVKWYKKSADQGNSNAQDMLGVCYINGTGVPEDPQEAVNWLQKSADQGNAIGQYSLAKCFLKSNGVEDKYKAVELLQKSADQGNAKAQLVLGNCNLKGIGVQNDPIKAKQWLEKSASQGNGEAQLLLSICYRDGNGVKKDEEEALKRFRKSQHMASDTVVSILSEKMSGIDSLIFYENFFKILDNKFLAFSNNFMFLFFQKFPLRLYPTGIFFVDCAIRF